MRLFTITTFVASLLTGVFARSSVHITSKSIETLETKPEISFDAFTMYYSHLLDSSSNQPILRLQDDITPLLPTSNNLFEKKVDGNLVVVVNGVNKDIPLKDDTTSFYVANDEPSQYMHLFETMDTKFTVYKKSENNYDNFKYDFDNYNLDVFNIEKEADKNFIDEIETLMKLTESKQAVYQLNSLNELGSEYGFDSKQYQEALLILTDCLENYVIPTFQKLYSRGVSTFILTPYRVVSGATCFTSLESCETNTSTCSGNGQCTMVKEDCYACQCKSSSFAGESCQYINAVSDFQLLFWTSVLLIVITSSVVVCIYQAGNDTENGIILTQSAPKHD